MDRQALLIGEVARRTGLSIHTIRFYEAERLLPEALRTESGYRLYSQDNIEALKFIKNAQQLGFSLAEVRELLLLRDRPAESCVHVRSVLREKLESVREKLRRLEAMEKDLKRSLALCERELKRHGSRHGQRCPVLAKLGREN